jgi:hypothetical protein
MEGPSKIGFMPHSAHLKKKIGPTPENSGFQQTMAMYKTISSIILGRTHYNSHGVAFK